MIITSPTARRYIYTIATAVIALLAVYGIISGDQVQAWTGLAAAVTAMAAANTHEPR